MRVPVEHIISSLNWDTTFNDKEKANRLQDRLSSLSRLKLGRELSGIFNNSCPEDQTWKIDSLELDLGVIDFNYLETELIQKLRERLTEKLRDLASYGGNATEKFEIIESGLSQIEALEQFLTNGFFPWNYKEKEGAVNWLIEELLKTHQQEVIAMIKTVGKKDAAIRRRIAWQIKEPTIIQIIRGLEPNESERIIEFSNELITLQGKETIVQGSVADLKKNLWFWVLNYLLSERGTLFNRVAFVKSSIRQMANHYNISYSDLLSLITRAVDSVTEHYHIHSAFVSTIKEISHEEESDTVSIQQPGANTTPDYSDLLNEFFTDTGVSHRRNKKNEFNKLVVAYSKKDAIGFRNFVQNFNNSEIDWFDVIKFLENQTLEIIFLNINPTNSQVVLQGISFMNNLNNDCELGLQRDAVWYSGIKLMLTSKNTMLNEQIVISCLAEDLLVENIKTNAIHPFQLAVSSPPIDVSTAVTNSFAKVLTSVFSDINETYYKKYLGELLNELIAQLSGDLSDKKQISQLKKMLIRCIQYNPEFAWDVFQSYQDKSQLAELFYAIYTTDEILGVLVKLNAQASKLILPVLNDLEHTGQKLNYPTDEIRNTIITSSLSVVLEPSQLNVKDFINFTKTLKNKYPGTQDIQSEVSDSGKKIPENISAFSIEDVLKKKQSRAELLIVLKQHYTDTDFIKYRNESIDSNCQVLEHIVANGNLLRNNFIGKYALLIRDNVKNTSINVIKEILNELFWSCILGTTGFYGQAGFLESSFYALVQQRFPALSENVNAEKNLRGKKNLLNDHPEVSNEELYALLEKCFQKGKHEIEHLGKIHSCKDLLTTVLETNPGRLLQIMRDSIRDVKILSEIISFDQFCSWISSETSLPVSRAIRNIHLLSTVMLNLCSDYKQKELLVLYWEVILRIIRTNSYSSTELNKLVGKSLEVVQEETAVTVDSLIDEITRSEKEIDNELLTSFKGKLTGGDPYKKELLFSQVVINKSLLDKVQDKGLLYEFCVYLISKGEIPDWIPDLPERPVSDYLTEIISCHPVKMLQALKQEFIPEWRLNWLNRTIGFGKFISAIAGLKRDLSRSLSILSQFYSSLDRMNISSVKRDELQSILFRKLIAAWSGNNWRMISTGEIWNELFKETAFNSSVSKDEFFALFENNETLLPPAMKISLRTLRSGTGEVKSASVSELPIIKKRPEKKHSLPEVNGEALIIRNAGLVLINNYVAMLFDRIGITKDRNFVSLQKQMDAVHYLQYVATGMSETEEAFLPLNKVLCGIPVSQPIPDGVEIPDEHKKIIESLIKAVIGYWPEIGDTSLNGFRGNWLVREGKLSEQKDRWELLVEKRAYDILINKSPFSFSIIKHPWMDKPLHVTWSY